MIIGRIVIIGRVLGWVLVALSLALAGTGVWLWLSGEDLTLVAGQLWFQTHGGSLNLTQSIIQRYIHPGLWDGVLLPLLQRPAYQAIGLSAAALLAAGVLVVALLRTRRPRRPTFR